MKRSNSLNQQTVYRQLLKEAKWPMPGRNGGRRKPINNHQPKDPVPSTDVDRMEQVCNMVNMYRRGWLTAGNAVLVIKDIVR